MGDFLKLLRNGVIGATMADQPAVMTASGWRQDSNGDYVQDQQNHPDVEKLRDNLSVIAGTADGEAGLGFGIESIEGLIKNKEFAKSIKKLIDKTNPQIKEPPLNVGWGPKQTIHVQHASDSPEPLQLFFDKRWDVTNEGANPFGVWFQGKWGQPRTIHTNSLPGKAEKAEKARQVFANRKYKHEGDLTLDKPMTTVGDVPDRSVLSYEAEKMGADGIIYNNVYDNGYDNNQVIFSFKNLIK